MWQCAMYFVEKTCSQSLPHLNTNSSQNPEKRMVIRLFGIVFSAPVLFRFCFLKKVKSYLPHAPQNGARDRYQIDRLQHIDNGIISFGEGVAFGVMVPPHTAERECKIRQRKQRKHNAPNRFSLLLPQRLDIVFDMSFCSGRIAAVPECFEPSGFLMNCPKEFTSGCTSRTCG